MALAISTVDTFKDTGREFRAGVTIAGSSTYATGGQTVSFKNNKIKTEAKPTFGIGFSTIGHLAIYDVANDKVVLWDGTTEFTNGGDLSAVVVKMSFWFPKV